MHFDPDPDLSFDSSHEVSELCSAITSGDLDPASVRWRMITAHSHRPGVDLSDILDSVFDSIVKRNRGDLASTVPSNLCFATEADALLMRQIFCYRREQIFFPN